MALKLPREQGAVSVPLLLILISVTLLGMGSWGVLRAGRHEIERQLRLDRCVGEAARLLRDTLEAIEAANRVIATTRAAILASAIAAPEAVPPLQATLRTTVLYQEGWLRRWQLRQASWLAQTGCSDARGLSPGLPPLRWRRPPPDLIGEQALLWPDIPREFRVTLIRGLRGAAARVGGNPDGKNSGKREAHWAAPFTGASGMLPGAGSG